MSFIVVLKPPFFWVFHQLPMEDEIDLSDVDLDDLEKDELWAWSKLL